MSNLEKKREDFRKYLDSTGAIDNLTKALIKLYEQKNKPQDATKFLRKELCLSCHGEEEFESLIADLDESNRKICELEREIAKLKGSIKRSASEVDLALTNGFDDLTATAGDESILKVLLTKQIFDELKTLQTEFKGTLLDCIQAGFENLSTTNGIFACDPDAYKVFASLFNPLIEKLHDFKRDDKQPTLDWGESCKLPDFEEKYIKRVEISVSRNVVGYPFAAIMKMEHYEEIMAKLVNAVKCLCSGGIKGKLFPLDGISDDARKELMDENKYFRNDNVDLKNANATRFWPQGRAIYVNNAKTFYVWCNEQNHFKFIACNLNGNLRKAYELLIEGINQVSKDFEFVRDERLGFVTFSPNDLGTALHVSIEIEINNISQHQDKFNEIACKHNFKINKIDGVENDKLYEISNVKCMGMSEFEMVKELADGIIALIDVDKSL